MYPWIRFAFAMAKAKRMPPLAPGDMHRISVTCLPWDIDYQMELNNGRIITLFDLCRIPMFQRMGVLGELTRRGWYGTVLGSSLRYRRRITLFQRLEMRSRVLGVDERFFYIEQAIFRGDDCCAHALIRTAITTGKGIIPTAEVMEAFNLNPDDYPMTDWVERWSEADKSRPWPPMQDLELQETPRPV